MVADRTTATKDPKRTRDGGVVLEEIHDESEIGIITCMTIWPGQAVTIVELLTPSTAFRPAASVVRS